MDICIVVPSEEYLGLAGVRIRYRRIEKHLNNLGAKLHIRPIQTLDSKAKFKYDIYLFSKCYDARTVLIAQLIAQTDKLVGIDFFDDYFSQITDSRFVKQRKWLRSLSEFTNFYLCSTDQMRKVISRYLPEIPSHVLYDPFEALSLETVSNTTEQNLNQTIASRQINVAWFGTGDNPYFSVGLHDLSAYSYALKDLSARGYTVSLNLLTNKRALNTEGLEMLSRLPVSYRIDEWSVEKEKDLLSKSLVAFIPVNAQNFSIAKSSNRAVTALTAGTQVLSIGYPLYERYHEFIYRSVDPLLQDIEARQLKLRKATAPGLKTLFADCAHPESEAKKYHQFLTEQWRNKKNRTNPSSQKSREKNNLFGIIHGVSSQVACHKLSQKLGCLSISSPFSNTKLNYDVRFVAINKEDAQQLEVQLDKRALEKIQPQLIKHLKQKKSLTGKNIKSLEITTLFPKESARIVNAFNSRYKIERVARYKQVMTSIYLILETVLPEIKLSVSEANILYGYESKEG